MFSSGKQAIDSNWAKRGKLLDIEIQIPGKATGRISTFGS